MDGSTQLPSPPPTVAVQSKSFRRVPVAARRVRIGGRLKLQPLGTPTSQAQNQGHVFVTQGPLSLSSDTFTEFASTAPPSSRSNASTAPSHVGSNLFGDTASYDGDTLSDPGPDTRLFEEDEEYSEAVCEERHRSVSRGDDGDDEVVTCAILDSQLTRMGKRLEQMESLTASLASLPPYDHEEKDPTLKALAGEPPEVAREAAERFARYMTAAPTEDDDDVLFDGGAFGGADAQKRLQDIDAQIERLRQDERSRPPSAATCPRDKLRELLKGYITYDSDDD